MKIIDKQNVLEKVLANVPFDGWTNTSVLHAFKELSIEPSYIPVLFPNGINDIVDLFISTIDAETEKNLSVLDLTSMRIRDRIFAILKTRFEIYNRYGKAIIRKTFFYDIAPSHFSRGLRQLWLTTDLSWREAGDVSTDFNYYTKRAILSGVYMSTFLYWLNDTSPASHKTWSFLERRINDSVKFGTIKTKFAALFA